MLKSFISFQLKEVETSATKWRKNKKDLESQLKNIEKCEKEIKEKINLKTNDLKCVNNEIDDFQKRIDKNKKEIDAATKSLTTKKQASDVSTRGRLDVVDVKISISHNNYYYNKTNTMVSLIIIEKTNTLKTKYLKIKLKIK